MGMEFAGPQFEYVRALSAREFNVQTLSGCKVRKRCRLLLLVSKQKNICYV